MAKSDINVSMQRDKQLSFLAEVRVRTVSLLCAYFWLCIYTPTDKDEKRIIGIFCI